MFSETVFNVRQSGAKGDGKTKDTKFIQEAIDRCETAGGGTVYFPPGTYLTGTIVLKSKITLYLESGSLLLGSTSKADYPAELGTQQPASDNDKSQGSCFAGISPEHLIVAKNCDDITITGGGRIDGQGDFFFGEFDPAFHAYSLPAKGWRPFRMMAFRECRNLVIEKVTISNSPAWTVWLSGCDNVKIASITLRNNLRGPNTDGIDVDCSRNVHITNCHIAAGDDCIALKSSIEFFGYADKPCENVVVSNCTLVSPCNAIRLGYEGDGVIRNCTFNNIVFSETRTGVNILAPAHPEYGINHGPSIENILFSNLVMDVRKAFYIWSGQGAKRPASLKRILFDNIIAESDRANYVGGTEEVPVEEIEFRRVRLSLKGNMTDDFDGTAPEPYKAFGYWRNSGLPYAFFVRHGRNIVFDDVKIDRSNATGKWRENLKLDRCVNVVSPWQ
jgi:polygalacturonase